jgi:alpha-beta hydrolase superfamily lysophospholipase
MALAERFGPAALNQVTRYLFDELTRALAQQRVLDLVEDDTRVIVGHSLGSVVAYECAHRLSQPLPLLVTLGSPLGLRTIVTDHLRPPPSFPPRVVRWMNVADREDFVAAEPDLRPLFTHNLPEAWCFDGVTVDNGSEPHNPCYYLGKIAVGQAVCEALR